MFDNFLSGSVFAVVAAVALVIGAPTHHHAPRLSAEAPTRVVLMPEVQVIGKRSPEFASAPEVVRMPMVTVTGVRDSGSEAAVALAATH
jgi:hypothetical protein